MRVYGYICMEDECIECGMQNSEAFLSVSEKDFIWIYGLLGDNFYTMWTVFLVRNIAYHSEVFSS